MTNPATHPHTVSTTVRPFVMKSCRISICRVSSPSSSLAPLKLRNTGQRELASASLPLPLRMPLRRREWGVHNRRQLP